MLTFCEIEYISMIDGSTPTNQKKKTTQEVKKIQEKWKTNNLIIGLLPSFKLFELFHVRTVFRSKIKCFIQIRKTFRKSFPKYELFIHFHVFFIYFFSYLNIVE